jgi:hypothetical protein
MLPISFEEYLAGIAMGVEAIPVVLRKGMIPLLIQMVEFSKFDHLFEWGDALLLALEGSAKMIEKIRPQVLNLRSVRDAFVFLEELSDDQTRQVKAVIAKAFDGNGDNGNSLESFIQVKLGVKTKPRQEIKVKRLMQGKFVKDLGAITFYYLLENLRKESFIVDSPDVRALTAVIPFYWGMQGCFPIQDVSTKTYKAVLATKGEQHFLTKAQHLPDRKNWAVEINLYHNGN